jgi:hypothetical protein
MDSVSTCYTFQEHTRVEGIPISRVEVARQLGYWLANRGFSLIRKVPP